MSFVRRITSLIVGIAAIGTFANVHASVISFNWEGNGDDVAAKIPPATAAGFVPATNWNNATADNQFAGTTGSLLNLVNDSAASTSLDVSWTNNGNNFVASNSARTVGNEILFNAYMRPVSGTLTVTVSQIPYAQYELYAYLGLHITPRTGTAGLDGNTRSVTVKENGTWTSWQEVLPAGGTGNYIHWTGLTGSSFNLTTSGPLGIYGFQIVEVPEPTSFTMAAVGVVALMGVRRRRQSA